MAQLRKYEIDALTEEAMTKLEAMREATIEQYKESDEYKTNTIAISNSPEVTAAIEHAELRQKVIDINKQMKELEKIEGDFLLKPMSYSIYRNNRYVGQSGKTYPCNLEGDLELINDNIERKVIKEGKIPLLPTSEVIQRAIIINGIEDGADGLIEKLIEKFGGDYVST